MTTPQNLRNMMYQMKIQTKVKIKEMTRIFLSKAIPSLTVQRTQILSKNLTLTSKILNNSSKRTKARTLMNRMRRKRSTFRMISKTRMSKRRSKNSPRMRLRTLNKTITKLMPMAKSTYSLTWLNRCSRSSKRKRKRSKSNKTLNLNLSLTKRKTMMFCLLIELMSNSVNKKINRPETKRMVLVVMRIWSLKSIVPLKCKGS